MFREITIERRNEIRETIIANHSNNTLTQVARMLNMTPSSLRHHGKGFVFKIERHKTSKKVVEDGEFFVHSGKNYLL